MESQQRVALIVASLPQREAADLLARLPDDVVEQIARWLPSVDHLDSAAQDAAASELAVTLKSAATEVDDPPMRLVERVALCSALRGVSVDTLAGRMSGEMPQTIASLIRALEVDQAAELLARLPTHLQMAVVLRLRSAAPVSPQVLMELIEITLAADDPTVAIGDDLGVDTIARLLLRLDHATEKALLENLSQEDAALVDRLLQVKLILQDLDRIDRHAADNHEELVDAVLRLHGEAGGVSVPQGIPKAA